MASDHLHLLQLSAHRFGMTIEDPPQDGAALMACIDQVADRALIQRHITNDVTAELDTLYRHAYQLLQLEEVLAAHG